MVFTIKVGCDKAACGMRKLIEWKNSITLILYRLVDNDSVCLCVFIAL